jgi:glycosyltransferase involved in cell wall biosynthesis
MAMGRPVVAAAAGGVLELVQHGSTGLLYPPGDSTALASALRRLLNSASLRSELATAAASFARSNLDARRLAPSVLSAYQPYLRR